MRSRLSAMAMVLLCGFTCEPRPPGPVSLQKARELERAGRIPEAVAEYSRLISEVGNRADLEASQGLATIYGRLTELKAWEVVRKNPAIRSQCASIEAFLSDELGRPFLSLAMEADLRVLSETGPPEGKAESAARLSSRLAEKVQRPELRMSELEDLPVLHRIVLLEAAAGFEHRRLFLTRDSKTQHPTESKKALVECFETLSREYGALAEMTGLRAFARDQWKERREAYANLAIAVAQEGPLPDLPAEYSRWADFTIDRHLREGVRCSEQATSEVTTRPMESERQFRAALRHFIFGREVLAECTSTQDDLLLTQRAVVRSWQWLCFE